MTASFAITVAIILPAIHACPALYDANDNPQWALNVCLESTEYGGSYKLTCDDDGNPTGKVYATSDCSLVGAEQDIPGDFAYDYAVCNGTRCGFAKVRQYSTIDGNCDETDTYSEWPLVIGVCLRYDSYSEMRECTDNNVTKSTYSGTNCEGTAEVTTEYQDGSCDTAGSLTVLYEVTECNPDNAFIASIAASIMFVSSIMAIFM